MVFWRTANDFLSSWQVCMCVCVCVSVSVCLCVSAQTFCYILPTVLGGKSPPRVYAWTAWRASCASGDYGEQGSMACPVCDIGHIARLSLRYPCTVVEHLQWRQNTEPASTPPSSSCSHFLVLNKSKLCETCRDKKPADRQNDSPFFSRGSKPKQGLPERWRQE